MKVLHAFNRHRGGGGLDSAYDATIRIFKASEVELKIFEKDSGDLQPGLGGKMNAFFSGIYARASVREFDRLLSEFKPDVVHAHELFPLISPWILPRCVKAGVPIVYTAYDFRITCPMATHFSHGEICHRCLGGREHWAVMRNCRNNYAESLAFALRSSIARRFGLLSSNVSEFIVLSKFSKDWLLKEAEIDRERINVIPCSIPLPDTPTDPAAGEYIAFAGRAVPEKGLGLLIEAARKANLPLKIANKLAEFPTVAPGDLIEYVSPNSPEELAEFYRAARIVVVPSMWYETFGIVAAEALSHGVPVVASRVGALQDTVQDGITGLLFELNNVDDLTEKIVRLWNDEALCRTLGAAAYEWVRERFNEEIHFSLHMDTYERAINNPLPSR